jgi:hypothetical protein
VQCCSGTACAAAERQFGPAVARRDIQRYHRKGPDNATQGLLAGIRTVMPADGSLLDVGGGVGVVTFELLAAGLAQATLVDGSPSYAQTAAVEAERLGRSRQVRVVTGDFAAVASDLDSADVVTLHRVVCCSPRYDWLLREAATRCRRVFAFSYPRDRWYTRTWVRLDNVRRRLFGNPFRTFVHAPSDMNAILVESGLRRISRARTLVWCMDVYARAERT